MTPDARQLPAVLHVAGCDQTSAARPRCALEITSPPGGSAPASGVALEISGAAAAFFRRERYWLHFAGERQLLPRSGPQRLF